MRKKGKLRRSDYVLIAALPCLITSIALLHTLLNMLYTATESNIAPREDSSNAVRLTCAIELLWISIYSVKASFLAQFKLHKPPFAYVSSHLTRVYWLAIALNSFGFILTMTIPVVLCPGACKFNCLMSCASLISAVRCQYINGRNTRSWETALTAIDIVTDISGTHYYNKFRTSRN